MFGLTTTRRSRADLAAAKAETDRQRARATKAEKAEATAKFNRDQVLAQNADLHTANTRLAGRNKALGQRLAEAEVVAGFDPAKARRTAERIAALQKAAAEGRDEAAKARAEAKRERKYVAHLQKELDNAYGLPPGGPLSNAIWQPGYMNPKPDPEVSAS